MICAIFQNQAKNYDLWSEGSGVPSATMDTRDRVLISIDLYSGNLANAIPCSSYVMYQTCTTEFANYREVGIFAISF